MEESRFRYLLKYVGKYRVRSHIDLVTLDFPRDKKGNIDSSFDDLYINCKKGEIRHTYTNNVLALFFKSEKEAKSVEKEINKKFSNVEIYPNYFCDEPIILFYEQDLDKIAKIIKPEKYCSNIPPFSNLNLLNYDNYKLSSKCYNELLSIPKALSKKEKKIFLDNCVKKYDKYIKKYFGKDFNVEVERNSRNLDYRSFISYIGLWDNFIEFVNKEYRQK